MKSALWLPLSWDSCINVITVNLPVADSTRKPAAISAIVNRYGDSHICDGARRRGTRVTDRLSPSDRDAGGGALEQQLREAAPEVKGGGLARKPRGRAQGETGKALHGVAGKLVQIWLLFSL